MAAGGCRELVVEPRQLGAVLFPNYLCMPAMKGGEEKNIAGSL